MFYGLSTHLSSRPAKLVRLAGLAAMIYWQFRTDHPAGFHGRGLVLTVLLAIGAVAWIVWSWRLDGEWSEVSRSSGWELLLLAACGGVLVAGSNDGPGNIFVFVAAFSAGARYPLPRAMLTTAVAIIAICTGWIVYADGGLGDLAYALGLIATTFGGGQRHDALLRREQAELLLAQTQRSHEEQLRAAKLEESSRIAREIHDVLAHSLAGLTIQLEATAALIEGGAEAETILPRVRHAYELAREGLRETRLAVGALRSDGAPVVPAAARIEALVSDFRSTGREVELHVEGDREHLGGPAGDAAVRIVQESLTNATKHAPEGAVEVTIGAGVPVTVTVLSRGDSAGAGRSSLSASGGGYGIAGMRERAQELGGHFSAGPTEEGWLVRAELPNAAVPTDPAQPLPAVAASTPAPETTEARA